MARTKRPPCKSSFRVPRVGPVGQSYESVARWLIPPNWIHKLKVQHLKDQILLSLEPEPDTPCDQEEVIFPKWRARNENGVVLDVIRGDLKTSMATSRLNGIGRTLVELRNTCNEAINCIQLDYSNNVISRHLIMAANDCIDLLDKISNLCTPLEGKR